MLYRQKTSRYCAAVLFLAGINGVFIITAMINTNFRPELEIWLAAALIASLILHARAGFALSSARREIEMLMSEMAKFKKPPERSRSIDLDLPATKGMDSADVAILESVREATANDRVELYLQPIVSLPQRKIRYFESFSRLRNADGTILRPSHYLDAAERANRIGAIDNLILLRSVQALRRLGVDSHQYRVFCNISPATIFDRQFFGRFTDYLDANEDLAARLIFEFTYPAVEMMNEQVEENLDAIARRGYSFSVDHIRRFDLNWKKLRERNFRFVKCSSNMLLAENNGDDAARLRVKAFRDRLRENNIDLIVEKVEYESHVPEILTMGIDFGQGELFGAPRPAEFYIPNKIMPADQESEPVPLAVAS